MVYRSTSEMVQRVLPLIEHIADRTIDKARLLQYLSARAGVHWNVLEIVCELGDFPGPRLLIVRDLANSDVREIPYPECLPAELDELVQTEYRRLALDRPLTAMDEQLFVALFGTDFCSRCRWAGSDHRQVHLECHFAGRPLNFESV
ncbi:hypothetical protein BH23CHL5_BH23CHL5_11880 [soil metagenome]